MSVLKKVFLDECVDEALVKVFGSKVRVYTAKDFRLNGKDDPTVIERAGYIEKCLIVVSGRLKPAT